MKIKNFNKRLALNKNTIVNLNNDEMNGVHGGGPLSLNPICITLSCDTNCSLVSSCPTVTLDPSCPTVKCL